MMQNNIGTYKSAFDHQSVLDMIKDKVEDILTVDGLKEAAKQAVKLANVLFPEVKGIVRAELAEKWLLSVVEEYDNYIPILGKYMDLPLVDRFQAAAVRHVVSWAYTCLELEDKDAS